MAQCLQPSQGSYIHEWAKDRGLDLDADTMPLWDGTRLDYAWAVAVLASDGPAT